MISICTCSINAKFEVRTFIEALRFHNPDVDYEICMVHDDRVNDGSFEYFKILQTEYPELKISKFSNEDLIFYLEKLINYYEEQNLFPKDFREMLAANLKLYKEGNLFNLNKNFLWITSGILYNKARQMANGDILLITPSDYIYFYRLKDLELYVNSNQKNGLFYGKPNALYCEIVNGPEKNRHILYPMSLSNLKILTSKGVEISIVDSDFMGKIEKICIDAADCRSLMLREFHGQHVMTRKTFDLIGGFTEEWYGRAWADDKMTALGASVFWEKSSRLPPRFSFSFCSKIIRPITGRNEEENTLLTQIDPFYFTSPMPPVLCQIYLHKGYDEDRIVNMYRTENGYKLNDFFSKGSLKGLSSPPVRIFK